MKTAEQGKKTSTSKKASTKAKKSPSKQQSSGAVHHAKSAASGKGRATQKEFLGTKTGRIVKDPPGTPLLGIERIRKAVLEVVGNRNAHDNSNREI